MIEAKILNLAITDKGFAIIMKPLKSDRVIPIFIAPLEAQSIMTGFLGFDQPRPLTHDLVKNIFESCKIRLIHILIDSAQGDTFFAKLVIESNKKTLLIDARPSDAIAMSLRMKTPIFIDENILQTLGVLLEDSEGVVNVRETVPFSYQVLDRENEVVNGYAESATETEIIDTDSELHPDAKKDSILKLLDAAIKDERYEDAAKYRDELENLR